MARSASSGNYLHKASAVTVGGAGTVFVRFKPTWSSGSGQHYLWSYANAASNNSLSFQSYSGTIYCGWYISAEYRIVMSDAGMFSAGVWGNYLVDWDDSANLTHLYVNNALQGTSTGDFTAMTDIDRCSIGAGASDVELGVRPGDGDFAEFARWTRVLTADERAVLELGASPLFIPSGLARYYPIIGRASPEIDIIGGDNFSLTGTPAVADHPRIFLPYAQSDYFAGPSSTIYTLTADAGAFVLTGQDAPLRAVRKVAADAASFIETGQDAIQRVVRKVSATVGTFTLTGQDAALRGVRKVVADVGAFVETGIDASLTVIRRIAAGVGSFILTGNSAGMGFDIFAGVRLTISDSAAITCTPSDSSVLTLTVSDRLAMGEE